MSKLCYFCLQLIRCYEVLIKQTIIINVVGRSEGKKVLHRKERKKWKFDRWRKPKSKQTVIVLFQCQNKINDRIRRLETEIVLVNNLKGNYNYEEIDPDSGTRINHWRDRNRPGQIEREEKRKGNQLKIK